MAEMPTRDEMAGLYVRAIEIAQMVGRNKGAGAGALIQQNKRIRAAQDALYAALASREQDTEDAERWRCVRDRAGLEQMDGKYPSEQGFFIPCPLPRLMALPADEGDALTAWIDARREEGVTLSERADREKA